MLIKLFKNSKDNGITIRKKLDFILEYKSKFKQYMVRVLSFKMAPKQRKPQFLCLLNNISLIPYTQGAVD